ncbi:unnamed protein product, partial [Notodromas monacha]
MNAVHSLLSGAFLLPFVLMLLAAGLPLMFMELSLGQYASLGPIALYAEFAPLLRGLGWAMVLVSAIVMLYYNMIIAWTIYYIFASMGADLPWQTCEPEWSTESEAFFIYLFIYSSNDQSNNVSFVFVWMHGWMQLMMRGHCYSYSEADSCMANNGTYYNRSCFTSEALEAMNVSIASISNMTKRTPAEEYFDAAAGAGADRNFVLGMSAGIEETGAPKWQLVLCLLVAWTIVFLCLSKGVQTSGKELRSRHVSWDRRDGSAQVAARALPPGGLDNSLFVPVQGGADFRQASKAYGTIEQIFIYFFKYSSLNFAKFLQYDRWRKISVLHVVYFTALFPYVVLFLLFFRGITLPGAMEGIVWYLTPDLSKLGEAKVWGEAAVQIFFALSPAWGGLITLSSYNKFHNNCYKDALIVSASNVLTSIFAGFVIFSVIGFLAHELNVDIDKVVDAGPGLAFVVYPEVVARLPLAPLWSFMFFFMLLTLGLDSQASTFALMETVTTAILDGLPSLREKKVMTVGVVSLAGFLGGVIFCTPGGTYWLELLDTYAANWSVMLIATTECLLVAWHYGAERFLGNVCEMIGKQSKAWHMFWTVMWKYVSPTVLV